MKYLDQLDAVGRAAMEIGVEAGMQKISDMFIAALALCSRSTSSASWAGTTRIRPAIRAAAAADGRTKSDITIRGDCPVFHNFERRRVNVL